MSAGKFLRPLLHQLKSGRSLPPSVFSGSLTEVQEYSTVYLKSQQAFSPSLTQRTLLSRFYSSQADAKPDLNSASQEGNEPVTADDGSAVRIKKLSEEVDKLKQDVSGLMDKYKRSLAEMENLRTRLMKQVDDAKQFGIQSFVKDLLEVSDLLSLAIKNVPKDVIASGQNQQLKALFEGLCLTDAQLNKVFRNHGLERYDPLGEPFDPNFHEAVFHAPIPGKEANTIFEVTQTGFKLKNRVIRPAKVGVVKGT